MRVSLRRSCLTRALSHEGSVGRALLQLRSRALQLSMVTKFGYAANGAVFLKTSTTSTVPWTMSGSASVICACLDLLVHRIGPSTLLNLERRRHTTGHQKEGRGSLGLALCDADGWRRCLFDLSVGSMSTSEQHTERPEPFRQACWGSLYPLWAAGAIMTTRARSVTARASLTLGPHQLRGLLALLHKGSSPQCMNGKAGK